MCANVLSLKKFKKASSSYALFRDRPVMVVKCALCWQWQDNKIARGILNYHSRFAMAWELISTYIIEALSPQYVINRPISQIAECTCAISHDAVVKLGMRSGPRLKYVILPVKEIPLWTWDDLKTSSLRNGISYIGKMISLYSIRILIAALHNKGVW